jgi:hypothetical protein
MNLNSKAQLSIEVLVVIIFLTLFIYGYTANAEKIVESLEMARVKDQQQDILLAVIDFLSIQETIINDAELLEHTATFKIPTIDLASKRVMCAINFGSNYVSVSSADFGGIETKINVTNVTFDSNIILPSKKICGKDFTCVFYNTTKKLNCS